jgi:hypothetical protein
MAKVFLAGIRTADEYSVEMLSLYDEKGSCEICSSSLVKHRVDKTEYKGHAQRHIDVGDPVVITREGDCFINLKSKQ